MDEIRDLLNRQVGPFPVWQWAIILGGGVGLALVMRNATDSDSGSAGSGGVGGALSFPSGPASTGNAGALGGVSFLPDASVTSVTGPTAPTTNSEWQSLAFERIQADDRNAYTAFDVQQALERYLTGQATTADQPIISLALEVAGTPPDGAPVALPIPAPAAPDPDLNPDVPTLPQPQPEQPTRPITPPLTPAPQPIRTPAPVPELPPVVAAPAPKTRIRYTVPNNMGPDYLYNIANRFFGRTGRPTRRAIREANPGRGRLNESRSGNLQPGMRIWIPPEANGRERIRDN